MAFLRHTIITITNLILLYTIILSPFPQTQSQSVTESSIHDLLKSKGLPVGLFPKEVESFTLYDTGLSQEELFLWLPVKDIIVDDPKSGLILFDIGLAHKQLSLSLFEDPPDCKTEEDVVLNLKKKSRKEIGFNAQM
uniref:uncharacterized protein LOC122593410 isoform X2 n=1 Tax=Erigeron canadensis TaxID=72917 RepID=UPI001CB90781|nr:uncharacterized protein LOC122593410 isoform X2 [Erigeron canadensis]